MLAIIKTSILLIALTTINSVCGFYPVQLPSPSSKKAFRAGAPDQYEVRRNNGHSLSTINNQKHTPLPIIKAKKQVVDDNTNDSKQSNNDGMMGIFKKSPGTIVIAPFVLLFGLDLVLNIAVVTKRSLEVFFTGEYTVWTPWQ